MGQIINADRYKKNWTNNDNTVVQYSKCNNLEIAKDGSWWRWEMELRNPVKKWWLRHHCNIMYTQSM